MMGQHAVSTLLGTTPSTHTGGPGWTAQNVGSGGNAQLMQVNHPMCPAVAGSLFRMAWSVRLGWNTEVVQ